MQLWTQQLWVKMVIHVWPGLRPLGKVDAGNLTATTHPTPPAGQVLAYEKLQDPSLGVGKRRLRSPGNQWKPRLRRSRFSVLAPQTLLGTAEEAETGVGSHRLDLAQGQI